MADSSTIFSGSSRYANDFSQVITRAVSIASLPMNQMQQQRLGLADKAKSLASLDARLSALQSTLTMMGSSLGGGSLQTTSSDSTSVSVTAADGAAEGSYAIEVQQLGSATTFVASGFPSTADVKTGTYTSSATQTLTIDTDPSSTDHTPVPITLTPANSSLQALIDEINSKAGGSVRATAVNVGTSSSPNYQVSLQSTKLGSVDITLQDGAKTTTNTAGQRGTAVKYTVNGASVTSDSRTITIAPNVTATLQKQITGPVDISLKSSTDNFKSSLINFISAFNSVVSEIDDERGSSRSGMQGDSLLKTVSDSLRRIVNAPIGSGSIQSLAQMGVVFDKTGKISLDANAFNDAAKNSVDLVKSFVGSATTSGWLKTATGELSALEDTDHGIIQTSIKTNKDAMTAGDARIAAQQDRIDQLETNLKAQMAAADAAIATLEQQVTYFTGMWQAMRDANKSNN